MFETYFGYWLLGMPEVLKKQRRLRNLQGTFHFFYGIGGRGAVGFGKGARQKNGF